MSEDDLIVDVEVLERAALQDLMDEQDVVFSF
jgi:sulfur relay (sulfurtransferase) DsrF/TusC family protein